MAPEKVRDKRAWCQFGIPAIFLITFVSAIVVFIGKDIDFSIFTQPQQIPVFPTERSDNRTRVLSEEDYIPQNIAIEIKNSISKRINEEAEEQE